MNKKIAMSLMSITAALVVMGGATYAAFSGSASATNNTFATGTADLQIAQDVSGNAGTFGASIVGPNFTGILPGQSKTYAFWIRNNSTQPMGLDVIGDISAIAGDDSAQDLDNALLLSWTCDTSGNNSLGDETPTGEFSARDWFNGGNASLFLNLGANTNRYCEMTGRLPSTADNSVAGETLVFDAKYDATQVIPAP